MRFAVVLAVLIPSVARADAFEPPLGARNLCSEHTVGAGVEIQWTTWATKDDVAAVVVAYEKKLGKSKAGDKGERELSDGKDRRIAVYPVAKIGDFPSCAKKPVAGEKTIVLISRIMR